MCVLTLATVGGIGFGISKGVEDLKQKSEPADVPAPVQTPQPTPTPEPGEETASAESKRAKTAALKYGAMSTIRNRGGAAGLTGSGADLSNPSAQGGKKETLG